MRKLLAAGCVIAAAVSLTAQSPLTTTFAGGNGLGAGTMNWFDLQISAGVTITQIDINANNLPIAGSIDVYTIAGTHVGNETNSAAWTLQGNVPIALSNPTGTPTPCVFAAPFQLTPGNYGVAIAYNGIGQAYTNGPLAPFSTAEMSFVEGGAGNIWAGISFQPRVANISIHYSTSTGYATASPFGMGCGAPAVAPVDSFYEEFLPGPHDLAGLSVDMLYTGSGYAVTQGAVALRGPGAGVQLTLLDDNEALVTLSSPLTVPGGITNELMIASNGIISVADGGPTTWTPALATALNSPVTAWYTWTDLSPNLAGSGQVYVEDTATNVYVVYDGVYHYGTAVPYYFELHFDKVSGNVSMVFGPNTQANNMLIGFSAGGTSADPGATDLSDPLAYPFMLDTTVPPMPLALAADARPVLGTSFNLVTTEVPAAALLGGQIYGFAGIPGGFDLTVFGMPGCYQYASMDAVGSTVPGGAMSFSFPFAVPSTSNLVGLHIFAQSAVLGTGGINPLDAISSNGVDLMFDVN